MRVGPCYRPGMFGSSLRSLRRPLIALAIVLLATIVALPTLAADPPALGGKPDKAARPPAVPITVSGEVKSTTDANGKTVYTLTSAGTTYTLSAGPAWFFGDKHPLKASVGKTVTIVGERGEGSAKIDVSTVDGTALREAGKPPWAGGWKRVGQAHPDWTQEKFDRWQVRRDARMKALGVDCWPPGHCKKAAPAP